MCVSLETEISKHGSEGHRSLNELRKVSRCNPWSLCLKWFTMFEIMLLITTMGVFADWSQCNLNRIGGTPQAVGASGPSARRRPTFSIVQVTLSGRIHTIQLSHTDRERCLSIVSFPCPLCLLIFRPIALQAPI